MNTVLYIVLAIIGFFVFLQVLMRIQSYRKKGKTITGVNGELGRKIKTGSRLLVYFYSESCGACRPMTPVIEKLRKQYSNIFKIDIRQNPEMVKSFGIMGTPATVVVENEKISDYFLGAKSEKFLQELIDKK